MANLTISMSASDKAGITAFCEATGFTISSLFNVFTKTVLRERRLPFEVVLPETPNAETIAAMEEGERIARDPNVKGYTVEEALAEFKKW
ncbi:MAG: type II toxin-antitoxin system RelB/DinJ family antitoxin [Kiritimatiellia bacterium]